MLCHGRMDATPKGRVPRKASVLNEKLLGQSRTIPRVFLQEVAEYLSEVPASRPPVPRSLPAGVPLREITASALSPDGEIWIGGPEGAAQFADDEWRCYWGPRWLPDNNVLDIRFDSMDVCLLTGKGWSRIARRTMSLDEKAAHYQELTEYQHERGGFIARSVVLPELHYRATDNDGLWTGIYAAAQAFRYATTSDPRAKDASDRSLRAMIELERVTGLPGFPARCIIRPEEDGVVATDGEWQSSPVVPGVRWKGDTSSDELSGHFFAYYICHNLTKNPLAAGAAARILDHLLRHGLRLVDADGQPTEWADFSPASLNRDPKWDHEKGLNSLCILAYLQVGFEITGEERYRAMFRRLVDVHGYLRNAQRQKMMPPNEVNHSDDQLAFLAFYTLVHSLPEGNDRDLVLDSLARAYDIERSERCPLYNLVTLTAMTDESGRRDAIRTLEEWPWDLRDWECRNSHRLDVAFDAAPDRFGRQQLTRVLSPAERPVYRWNTNPYVPDGGGDGSLEEDGAAWLLAYWLGRYHDLV